MTAARIRPFARGVTLVAFAAAWLVAAALLLRTPVPSLDLGGLDEHRYFSARELARAHRYARGEHLLWLAGTIATVGALAVLTRRVPAYARRLQMRRGGTAIVVAFLLLVTLWAVSLPFGLAQLWWEHHWGLAPFDAGAWVLRQRYRLALSAVTGLLTALVVVSLAARFGRRWWIPGGALFVAVAAAFAFADGWLQAAGSRPLRDARLRADVTRIERREAVDVPVRVQKVSDWTHEANAFTSGFGPSAHVVLWDTLLDGRFSRGEVDVVIAHELGHARSRHVLKALAWFALLAFPAAFVVAEATRRRGGLEDPANLPFALLVLTVVSLAGAPFENAVSRRYEAEADWRALEATHDPSSARALFRRFERTSLEEPSPQLLAYVWLVNHPTLMQRIAMAERYAERKR
jgi:STE24 endopeptidase